VLPQSTTYPLHSGLQLVTLTVSTSVPTEPSQQTSQLSELSKLWLGGCFPQVLREILIFFPTFGGSTRRNG